MIERVLGDYGGIKVDIEPVENPEGEYASDELNRSMEDGAQLTRTSEKITGGFTATTTAAVTTAVTLRWHWTQWGGGATEDPTITKTATGLYTVAYSATYNDGLSVAETLAFKGVQPYAWTTDETEDVTAHIYDVSAASFKVALKEGGTIKDQTTGGNDIRCDFRIR